jgi:hypothetical protein
MRSRSISVACGLLLAALGGCQTSKSSNPTGPTVAGPIPGVQISAPGMSAPSQGAKFKDSEQPITLLVNNATTNGVRPLTYTFEVASDSNFASKVFARSGVGPGSGQTSVQIDRLPIGQSYYWRARAEDGANTGPFGTAGFEVYPKAAVNPPTPVSPLNGDQTPSNSPTLVVNNSSTVGPVGYLGYEFQIATDQAFTRLIAAGIVNEGAGSQTTFLVAPVPNGTTYYWRVRAADSETTSTWSVVQAFRTPAPPPPAPGPSPSPGVPGPVGNCDSLVNDKNALVNCIHASIQPAAGSVQGAFEVTKRVAWALRGEHAGLLRKDGGENIVTWQGISFSAGRICYPDGHIYKVISDVGGANGPSWSDNGFVDPSLYVPAIDPSKK